jgi:predicted dehydrogenase
MFRLGWGVIGAGDIVRRRVAPALVESPACDFVAITRARSELAAAALNLGARRWVPEWRLMLGDPEVHCIYVATPVHLHAQQVIAAAEAGRHVLCEKPMAMNATECDRMLTACRSNGVTLGVAYYRRFYPVVMRVKRLLESGDIGAPVFAQMNAFEWFDPDAGHPRGWLLNRSIAGGGPMMDFGCHRLEVLLNLFGPVSRTAALTANVVFTREVEDTAAAVLQFAGGPCASVVVTHAVRERHDSLDIFGTDGSIRCRSLNEGVIQVRTEGGERAESHPPAANVHRPLIDDFVSAVVERRSPQVDDEVGRAIAAIEDEIYAVAPAVH